MKNEITFSLNSTKEQIEKHNKLVKEIYKGSKLIIITETGNYKKL